MTTLFLCTHDGNGSNQMMVDDTSHTQLKSISACEFVEVRSRDVNVSLRPDCPHIEEHITYNNSNIVLTRTVSDIYDLPDIEHENLDVSRQTYHLTKDHNLLMDSLQSSIIELRNVQSMSHIDGSVLVRDGNRGEVYFLHAARYIHSHTLSHAAEDWNIVTRSIMWKDNIIRLRDKRDVTHDTPIVFCSIFFASELYDSPYDDYDDYDEDEDLICGEYEVVYFIDTNNMLFTLSPDCKIEPTDEKVVGCIVGYEEESQQPSYLPVTTSGQVYFSTGPQYMELEDIDFSVYPQCTVEQPLIKSAVDQ